MSNTNQQRILIADDEQYIRELYQEVLEDAGYAIETAKDGKEALEKITAGGYDLIALDVVMPQLDGLGVLQKLQNAKLQQANGPILLLTSLVNDPAVKDAENLGVKQVLYKTEINPQQLVDVVIKLIGQPAAKPAAQDASAVDATATAESTDSATPQTKESTAQQPATEPSQAKTTEEKVA
ncbi:MAG: response regulator [Patescibacteria group bacterium]